ncbi:hypothetical protein D3C71_1764460 [compost metagenome]
MAAAMKIASIAVAPSRGQMLGKTGALPTGAARCAGAAAGLTGRGALQLKHCLLAAGFCQLQRGHCMDGLVCRLGRTGRRDCG